MEKYLTLFVISIFCFMLSCDTPKAGSVSDRFRCVLTNTEVLTNECETDFICSYKMKNNSILKTSEYDGVLNGVEIIRGENWVFKIEREYDDNPNIADDEFKETIQFAVPPCDKSFYFEGKDFEKLVAIYGSEAYSRDRGFYSIDQGCVEGKKQADGKWLVQMQFELKTRTQREVKKSVKVIFDK